MSSPSDRIQSLITGLDRILNSSRSRNSQLQFAELWERHQILERMCCDNAARTAIVAALDSKGPAAGESETDARSPQLEDCPLPSKQQQVLSELLQKLPTEHPSTFPEATAEKPPPPMQTCAPQSGKVSTTSMSDALNSDAIDILMNREPDSTSSPDVLGTHADTVPASEADLGFLDLELSDSKSRSSADEAAAAIDLELDEAVKQSATRQNLTSEESPIENLYASLLNEKPLAPTREFSSDSDCLSPGTIVSEEKPEANDSENLDTKDLDATDLNEPAIASLPIQEPAGEPEETVPDSQAALDPSLPSPSLSPPEEEPSSSAADELASSDTDDGETAIAPEEPESPEARETIAALTDLIPQGALSEPKTSEETALHTWEALQMNPEAPLTEDDYLLASPDEDLLSGDGNESLLEQEQNLRLDPTIVEQLESDLYRLEDRSETIAPEETLEGLERSPTDTELSDADLDAIFPAFLLEEDTPTEDDPHPPSSAEPPPELKSRDSQPELKWYLGLDFGATGLSAVLLDRLTGMLYPIYWLSPERSRSKTRIFRWPAAVYATGEETAAGESSYQMVAVGPEALDLARAQGLGERNPSGVLLQRFKSWLNLGLPWHDDDSRSQPILEYSQDRQIPLGDIQRACQALLSAIETGQFDSNRFANSQSGWLDEIPIPVSPHLPVAAFPDASVSQALEQLAGAIVNVPASASEAYRFNLREALVRSKLVGRAEQIMFVEDAIATVLSALPSDPLSEEIQGEWQVSLARPGSTLAIDAGATTTEFVLADLPERREDLSHDCFVKHSFHYGGDAIDLDIIAQLLLSREEIATAVGFDRTVQLPQPGEPDLSIRIALERWLHGSPLRLALLEVAPVLKLALQERDRHVVKLGSIELTILRRDLEARVLVPYVQNVNRELNVLLSQTGTTVEGIDRALCTGGSASWEAIALWLRQKLPNAIVMQDVYPSHRPPGCSRVAYGLATLPLYPKVLDELPQQYSDYFLVRELLEVCPDRSLSVLDITTLLEARGLNVRACRARILAILAGELPRGLVPQEPEATWLSLSSGQHRVYRALRSAPLFYPDNARTYRPNREQFALLRQYFQKVTANSEQTWQEPLTIDLEILNA